MAKIIDEKFIEKIKADFKNLDVDFYPNTLKAFTVGAIFVSQLKEKGHTDEEIKKILLELMDLADEMYAKANNQKK